ncbi:MAG: serine protease [Chloroflexi bacterium RBG_13_46_14]|nr:MAG: serine protease [Chloroflexi bacterium RBG_13_46_14]
MFKILRVVLFAGMLITGLAASTAQAAATSVHVLTVDGTIVPVIADYIDRGIGQAEDANADVCVIELNTPGGLLDTTEEIVQRIMNAHVPVVVYVSPKGSWAASAGTFITLSGHIAAMTPGTTIGAAHPVTTGGEDISEDQMKKVTEFSAKWIGTIAEERNRNIEEAQLAVTESKSFTDIDALEANIIDLRANSLEDLLSQIDGVEVTLASGATVTVNTGDHSTTRNEMSFIERFLHAISDPNIAYILMSVGSIGIMAEIYNPGGLFPGIIGAICLLMAFYSLGVLDANIGGILLMLLALGLFVAEFFTPTFGILTAGGVTALVLGSLLLFPDRPPVFRVNPWLIGVMSALFVGFFLFIIQRIIKIHRRQPSTGWEELIGKPATVMMTLSPEGQVLFRGEHWIAISEEGTVEEGEQVIINRVENLKLYVSRKETGQEDK